MKKKILIFCQYYLPGFRSGGGMWTVVNLIDRFCHKYDFFVVTRNYDSANGEIPFDTVITDEWNPVGNAIVFYFGKGSLSVKAAASLVESINPDAIFLNSAFGIPSLRLLTARRRQFMKDIPVILAPCGELGTGALALKPLKKRIFLRYAQLSKLYHGVIWKASSETEKKEIAGAMRSEVEIFVAPDLVPKSILPDYSQEFKPEKVPGKVRFVLMSRIVAKKNIHFFLECLREVKKGEVFFEIIGPIEEESYWTRCEALISSLPENVSINVTGPLKQAIAIDRVFKSHFFALPSLNENFGYVFIESLAAGTPLLISDQTMWSDLDSRGVGWTISLDRKDLYVSKIRECIEMDGAQFSDMSSAARTYALNWLADTSSDRAMENVFERAINGSTSS